MRVTNLFHAESLYALLSFRLCDFNAGRLRA